MQARQVLRFFSPLISTLLLFSCEGISTFQSAQPNIAPGPSHGNTILNSNGSSWNAYLGSYQLTRFDGNSVTGATAQIKRGEGKIAGLVYDVDTLAPIPAIVITLTVPESVSTLGPLSFSIFTDRGHFSADASGEHYYFNGYVTDEYLGAPETLRFHSKLNLKSQPDGMLELDFTRFVDDTTRPDLYNAQASALLEPIKRVGPTFLSDSWTY